MSTIVKESEALPVSPESVQPRAAAGSAAPNESAPKPQPVALEVSITVNGARSVDGSDKREPFSESSKTVLVFGNGAVIRLQSSVAPGQLLFLTNEKTKKEVVCQVVKSKNYRNVSGYVELEFTEPVVGFWGMRFPGERVAPLPVSAATPAAAPPLHAAPAAGTPAAPALLAAPPPPAPAISAALPPAKPSTSTMLPSGLDITSLSRTPETKLRAIPAIPAAPPTPASVAPKPQASQADAIKPESTKPESTKPVATDPTEALRAENARLQQQLSALLFPDAKKSALAIATPAEPENKPLPNLAAKVLEIAAPPASHAPSASLTQPVAQTPLAPPTPPALSVAPPPVNNTPAPAKLSTASLQSLLDEEPVKIPAWLEPLARNTAMAPPPEANVESESLFVSPAPAPVESKTLCAVPQLESPANDLSVPQESAPVADASVTGYFEVPAPTFGSGSLFGNESASAEAASGSKKGLLFAALAAGALLAAGAGYWYTHQDAPVFRLAQTVRQSATHTNAPAATPAAAADSSIPAAAATSIPATQVAPSASAANSGNTRPAGAIKDQAATPAPLNTNLVVSPARSAQPAAASSAPASQPVPNSSAVAAVQPKKASLGAVHLAAPTVSRKADGLSAGDVDPSAALVSSSMPADSSLGATFASNSAPVAPSTPAPIGGDVKTAKLLKSIPPVYPSFAKNQRVSGDVKVDALIDATGNVTTMKVVSGPVMLHQAAMDALRQWKYQSATLDGKPVPMHLTVTIQFRLQ